MAPGFSSLSQDLVQAILLRMPAQERKHVAAVCMLWRDIVQQAQTRMFVWDGNYSEASVGRLLAAAAGRRDQIVAFEAESYPDHPHEVATLVRQLPELRELLLWSRQEESNGQFDEYEYGGGIVQHEEAEVPSWLPAMTQLHTLKLDIGCHFHESLCGLTRLTSLHVGLCTDTEHALPRGLTWLTRLARLCLSAVTSNHDPASLESPSQLALLPELKRLEAEGLCFQDLRWLQALTALTRLHLESCALWHLFPGMPAPHAQGLSTGDLSPILEPLTQLQHVSLAYNGLDQVPPCLPTLTGLSALVLAGNQQLPVSALPPGAYQHSLRCLDISEMVPGNQLGVLLARLSLFPHLTKLSLGANPRDYYDYQEVLAQLQPVGAEAVPQLQAALPRLQWLEVPQTEEGVDWGGDREDGVGLGGKHPGLRITPWLWQFRGRPEAEAERQDAS